MGGHGLYVWTSYGLAAFLLIGLLILSWRAMRVREREAHELQATIAHRRGASQRAEDAGDDA